jgi:hypothetical protein
MYMVRSLKKCILAMKRQARKKNNQSAGVVGEDPRISN